MKLRTILLLVMLAGGCSASTDQVAPSPTNELEGAPLSTTTTIDLSFLNTTTTTTTMPRVSVDTTGVDVWDRLASCETGGNWAANTGNGFGGGVQFAHGNGWSTWRAFGGEQFAADPWDASREQQIMVAERVLASSGWRAWPGCARVMGLN